MDRKRTAHARAVTLERKAQRRAKYSIVDVRSLKRSTQTQKVN